MLQRLRSGRVLAVLAGITAVLAVAAYAVYDRYLDRPGDVSNPNVEFVDPTATPEEGDEQPRERRRARPFTWARFGFTRNHDRNFQPGHSLKGPFKRLWRVNPPLLVEFPPVMHGQRLYLLAGNGQLRAMRLRDGRTIWKKRLGTLSASSPALDERRAYVTLLEDMQGRKRGRVVAVRKSDGRTAWARNLSSRTESSPLVHGGRMYFGTEDGTLYALSTRTGRTVWTFRARGSIKGSPTLANGRLYFGDYGGYVHAVRARNGRAAWSQPVAARAFRGGRFYATAAVNWGRVFIGSTDGRQYALSARTGALAWARQTGNYVYSSAALANVPRRGPTVFFGSYDGNLYALDARSGSTRWTFRSGDRISGSPTVIGNVVYFSDLGRRRTFGIDIRSGERVFRRPFGAYDPVISDGRHLIVTGHRRVVAYRAANAPPPHKVRQPQGTGLPAAQWANRQRARRAAQQRRAQLRRCAQRDTRRARSRCRARIRRQ